MCGIAGFSGSFDPSLLSRMNHLLAHRGPDDAGEWLDQQSGVGLANRRLAIIDLSPEGHQPMSNADESILLAYNGEVYNFRELRQELLGKGHQFRSQTDTEVLIHLYEEEGLQMLSRLNGIFALALWDSTREQLLLARDGIGVKPLYYAQIGNGLVFASELKALLLEASIPRDIDLAAVHYHLAYLWAPAPYTLLKSVRKLPPGHAMLVKRGRVVREWAYYDLTYGGEQLSGSPAELAAQLLVHLEQAVKRQMMSDVPIGAMFSGGLDSSAVVAMMQQAGTGQRLPCYTIGFENEADLDGSPQDLPYARKVAQHLGVDLRPILVRPDMIDNLERMLYHLDEPQADPAPINSLLIAEQASREGIKVLLSGSGGDDIFSGYRRHWALSMERSWGWMPLLIRKGVANWANHGSGHGTLRRRLHRALAYADLPPEDRLISYFFWTGEGVRRSLYTGDLSRALQTVDTAGPLRSTLQNIPGEGNRLNRMLYLEGKHFLPDHNLNYLDKTGMAAGVEIRVPLLDLDLVDFAIHLPPSIKMQGNSGKYLLKKAMESFLPKDAIHRPKTGFGAPLRRWLRRELKELVDDILSKPSLASRGFFDPQAVHNLLTADRQGKVDAAYTIFAMLCLELWCRRFIDQPMEATPGVR